MQSGDYNFNSWSACSEREEGHLVMKSQVPKSANENTRQGKTFFPTASLNNFLPSLQKGAYWNMARDTSLPALSEESCVAHCVMM